MSVQAVEDILRRANEDPSFRRQLERDPEAAMHGYEISYWERAALIAGDEGKLEQLGVSHDLSRLAARYNEEGDALR